ncbi:MAG: hypothetical protein A2289_10085 [Deltaproteobacteria bacterium RIFOXYA12_FULL_58_15]|nr:MAG: hypothetical protein A2289_10085 [Deltaproteobacteria bacterium RIFOXYA12_FULL_58_15]OGR08174.1 MAG: hypothetical protein A2341_20130 [Deltaproteobacteria bacterium RIFOXYB12_FULL_58_9]
MTSVDAGLEKFLVPTETIESEAPAVRHLAESLRRDNPTDTAIALFNWVRDEIRYEAKNAIDNRELYRSTVILERRTGYCVQKAVLLAALGRAVGIPTRLGFADVRNHKLAPWMERLMGTNLFVYHGYVEFFLVGGWVKATPAFDAESSRKAGVLPVELDGTHDAMLHPVDPEGQPYIEYVRDRGTFADLPFEDLWQVFQTTYGLGMKKG